ncbi:MAG TPA: DUF167 domain-containing protein [Bacteroidota bacterium]|nr:DUF167 domain-containing protein [Bacteroidota bacterium]
MRIQVYVKTQSRNEGVAVREDGSLVVHVRVLPIEGKANKRVIELLSRYLKKPKSSLRIIAGLKSKQKLIEVIE